MYIFNQEQKNIQLSARKVVDQIIEPDAAKRDLEKQYPEEIINQLKELGYYSLMIPDEYGGTGLHAVSSMIIVNEIARSDASIAQSVAVANFAYLYPIYACAGDSQKQTIIQDCIKKNEIGTFAVNEPNGTSGTGLSTAVRQGDFFVLNGSKTMISNAPNSDYALVQAKTDLGSTGYLGYSIFQVKLKDNDGVSITKTESKLGLNSLQLAGIKFEDVKLPMSSVIGEVDQGHIVIVKMLELMSISNAAVALGIAERAYFEALNYTRIREVYGQPMCTMDSVRMEMAELRIKLTWLRLLVFQTAHLYDKKDPNIGVYFSVVKQTVTEHAKEICDRVLQLFSGYGYMEGYIIERLYRDVRAFTVLGCTSEVHSSFVAASIYNSSMDVYPWD